MPRPMTQKAANELLDRVEALIGWRPGDDELRDPETFDADDYCKKGLRLRDLAQSFSWLFDHAGEHFEDVQRGYVDFGKAYNLHAYDCQTCRWEPY